MPKTLLEKNGYRLYVRGPKDDSRYFVSHFDGTLFRRLSIEENAAEKLLDPEGKFKYEVESMLLLAKAVSHKQYHETEVVNEN